MPRLRLYDCRLSRLPGVIGLCVGDVTGIANAVNSAQRQLLMAKEASDESWYGTWAEVRLNVSRAEPYITLPREIARLEAVTVCDRAVPVFNQFYEYLLFGNGRMAAHNHTSRWHGERLRAAYTRNNAVLFTDLTNAPQLIAIYGTNPADLAGTSRVLLQGLDQNGNRVYSQDGLNQVDGVFVTLKSPFATSTVQFSRITGVQKDITSGPVQIFQLDPATAAQVLLLVMEPSETTASYRRYYFDHLPCGGRPPAPAGTCPAPQVTAIAKLELIPVATDTDYLLLQNLEAIIEECMAIRMSEIEDWRCVETCAVRLLNGELGHYYGINNPAVRMQVFGSARLEHQRIGTLR